MEVLAEDIEILSYQKEQEEITMGKVLDEKIALIEVLRAQLELKEAEISQFHALKQ